MKRIAGDKGDGFIAVEGVRGCSLNLETNNCNAGNLFPEIVIVFRAWCWSLVSDHGHMLLFLADDPGMRLQDIAASLRITERSAHGIVTDLTAARYISKHNDDRRHRDPIMAHQPLPEPITREETFREVLALLPGAAAGQPPAEREHR